MTAGLMELILELKHKCAVTDDAIRCKTPLSPSEYKGLTTIRAGERLSAAEFSERMGLSASRGSRVIDKMIRQGYLNRSISDSDRRQVFLHIASRGIAMQQKITEMMSECEERLKKSIKNEDVTHIKRSLHTLVEAL
jgi:DNA-binding MarR family transcriptional regulator